MRRCTFNFIGAITVMITLMVTPFAHSDNPEHIAIQKPIPFQTAQKYDPPTVLAAKIGQQHGVGDIMKRILKQESNNGKADLVGGTHLPVGKRYYGVMQMKVVAVREVMRKRPEFTKKYFTGSKNIPDEFVIAKLITDNEFSIEAATLYYTYMKKLAKRDTYLAVAAYNQGPSVIFNGVNAAGHSYAQSVLKHSKS